MNTLTQYHTTNEIIENQFFSSNSFSAQYHGIWAEKNLGGDGEIRNYRH